MKEKAQKMFSRKRKSGNGYSGRQWFYVLVNIPFIFVIKQGITKDRLWERIREINADSPMTVDVPIFAIKVIFAWNIEDFFKRNIKKRWWLKWLSVDFFKGTGKTERFLILVPIASIPFVLVMFVIEWLFYIAMVVGSIYLLTQIK